MIVVDASIALAWLLNDPEVNRRYADRIAALALESGELLAAPRVLVSECAYRLLKQGRDRRWSQARFTEACDVIDGFDIRYFDSSDTLADRVRFALRHNVQGFDAAYLALAIALPARLATLDRGLRSAARAAGVELA